jgi:hypothetical protein
MAEDIFGIGKATEALSKSVFKKVVLAEPPRVTWGHGTP